MLRKLYVIIKLIIGYLCNYSPPLVTIRHRKQVTPVIVLVDIMMIVVCIFTAAACALGYAQIYTTNTSTHIQSVNKLREWKAWHEFLMYYCGAALWLNFMSATAALVALLLSKPSAPSIGVPISGYAWFLVTVIEVCALQVIDAKHKMCITHITRILSVRSVR